MHRFVLSCFVFLLFCKESIVLGIDIGAHQRSFVQSLELFDNAKSASDYHESARILETIVASGVRSGAVYYNLGNAYFRAGEYGRAILNYRKALPYRPGDSYLQANLQQAIAAAPGKLAELPKPWWFHVLFWTDWISYPTKARVCCTAVCAAAISILLSVYMHWARLQWLTIGLMLLSSALGLDLALNYRSVVGNDRAVITGETTPRKGMGNSYEPAFDQPLRDGAEFTVLNATQDWTLGHFEGIGDAWVRNEFVGR